MKHLRLGDPPGPGQCKLRIRSNGDPFDTRVTVVDSEGVERELLGVEAVGWNFKVGVEPARAEVTVLEADVEVEAEAGKVTAA